MHQCQVPVQEVQEEDFWEDELATITWEDLPAGINQSESSFTLTRRVHPSIMSNSPPRLTCLFLFMSLVPLRFIWPSCVARVLFIDQLDSVA